MLNWMRVTRWLVGKLISPWFQFKVYILQVCLKTLSVYDKEKIFQDCRNQKAIKVAKKLLLESVRIVCRRFDKGGLQKKNMISKN